LCLCVRVCLCVCVCTCAFVCLCLCPKIEGGKRNRNGIIASFATSQRPQTLLFSGPNSQHLPKITFVRGLLLLSRSHLLTPHHQKNTFTRTSPVLFVNRVMVLETCSILVCSRQRSSERQIRRQQDEGGKAASVRVPNRHTPKGAKKTYGDTPRDLQ